MRRQPFTFEVLLLSLAFLLALGLRFLNLGQAPLSESEAGWALQALQFSGQKSGMETALGPQPAYVLLTAPVFALFGSSNILARLWPALAGALLVLVPVLFRKPLGRIATLILAFGLALDPGLTAVSRLAGSPMMALSFSLLALGFWHQRRMLLAGIFTGLALLAGPALILGAIGLALAWAVTRLVKPPAVRPASQGEEMIPAEEPPAPSSSPGAIQDTRLAWLAAAAVILLAGTLFLRVPQGLAAWFNAIPAFLQGWTEPSGIPPARLLLALVAYQPLALVFGFLGALRPWIARNRTFANVKPEGLSQRNTFFLLIWALAALVAILVYPARQVADLVWVLVPLWALAAYELSHFLPERQNNLVSIGQAVLLVILFALFWYTTVALNRAIPGLEGAGVQVAVLVGIVALAGLTTAMVGLGWSWQVGRYGLVWGISAALLIWIVSALWSATQVRPNQPQELWSEPPGTGQANLLLQTLTDLSEWHTGLPQSIDIVATVDSAALRWALRSFPDARFVSTPASGELPAIMITRQEELLPSLTASYRGQDFTWGLAPGWSSALPPNPVAWLTYHEAPVLEEQIILWARSDLFPGGSLLSQESP